MHRAIWIAAAAVALGGCARTGRQPVTSPPMARSQSHGVFSRLETNDWLVSKQAELWKVHEDTTPGTRFIGYLLGRDYRQEAGGPTFKVYTVTTLNRGTEIGHIDQMGRAVRYEPLRGGGTASVDVGQGTLEDSVGAIFDLKNPIVLEKTSERHLAFEALDRDGSGSLEAAELRNAGSRVAEGDRNRDGKVDFEEFDALDVL